jgi:predicted small lipoprotein YifL
MRHTLRRLTAVSIVAAVLAGCGQAGPTAPATSARATAVSAQSTSAEKLAREFGFAAKPRDGGKVTIKKAVVTVSTEKGGTVTYDFTETPRTQKVKVTTEGYTVEVDHDKLMEAAEAANHNLGFAPALIIPIAIDVAVAGAKAYAFYYIKHHGEDFDQKAAIQVTVTAMTQALICWVPYGQYFQWLVPFVIDFVMHTNPSDVKEAVQAVMAKLDALVEVIKHILHKDPAPKVAF